MANVIRRRMRTKEPGARREEAENEQRKEENEMKANPLPLWAVRLGPGCIIDCSTEAVNADTVDGAARVIDVIIMTHLKNRYKPFYSFMVDMDAASYRDRVIASGVIPEFENYFHSLASTKTGS
jgi:hypothetical protein